MKLFGTVIENLSYCQQSGRFGVVLADTEDISQYCKVYVMNPLVYQIERTWVDEAVPHIYLSASTRYKVEYATQDLVTSLLVLDKLGIHFRVGGALIQSFSGRSVFGSFFRYYDRNTRRYLGNPLLDIVERTTMLFPEFEKISENSFTKFILDKGYLGQNSFKRTLGESVSWEIFPNTIGFTPMLSSLLSKKVQQVKHLSEGVEEKPLLLLPEVDQKLHLILRLGENIFTNPRRKCMDIIRRFPSEFIPVEYQKQTRMALDLMTHIGAKYPGSPYIKAQSMTTDRFLKEAEEAGLI